MVEDGHTLVISKCRRLKPEDHCEFEASLGWAVCNEFQAFLGKNRNASYFSHSCGSLLKTSVGSQVHPPCWGPEATILILVLALKTQLY